MIACIDVDYRKGHAVAACVLFEHWTDEHPATEVLASVEGVAEYEPGAFYKRELPCILAVLAHVHVPVNVIVVDGYVWLGAGRPGLGARLYDALERRTPVVGVAKTAFRGNDVALPILRGSSVRPLFVTAIGMAAEDAAERVRAMHGRHRIPTLLARVDRMCRA